MSISAVDLNEPYSPLVTQLFERRPHAGRMALGEDVAEGQSGSQSHGTEVRFWLKFSTDRIQATSFLAFGCPHVVAGASWLAQHVRGMQLQDAARINWREIQQALSAPAEKRGRLLIVADALAAAVRAARRSV